MLERMFEDRGIVPSADAIKSGVALLTVRARRRGVKRPVFLRVGNHEGRIYVDLCNDRWEVVEVDASGWSVVAAAPVRFRRSAGMLPLPTPQSGGDMAKLWNHVNVKSGHDRTLTAVWLMCAIYGRGPFPVLPIGGESGSAKTSATKRLRMLIDPNAALLNTPPTEERNAAVEAHNSYILAYDNLSSMAPELSDRLCRFATGYGFRTRTNYTDKAETIIAVSRPVVFNGIENIVGRGDLIQRSYFVTLRPITDEARKYEHDLEDAFNRDAADILGLGLLDAAVIGMRPRPPHVKLSKKPRMADAAKWALACLPALGWTEDEVWEVIDGNVARASDVAVEASAFATAVHDFAVAESRERGAWEGTASHLLSALYPYAVDVDRRSPKVWPSTPNRVAGWLRRIAPDLPPRPGPKTGERLRFGKGRAR